jgi:hypothetical protein
MMKYAINKTIEAVMEHYGWIRKDRHDLVVMMLESEADELMRDNAELRRNYAALQSSVDVAGLALARVMADQRPVDP